MTTEISNAVYAMITAAASDCEGIAISIAHRIRDLSSDEATEVLWDIQIDASEEADAADAEGDTEALWYALEKANLASVARAALK